MNTLLPILIFLLIVIALLKIFETPLILKDFTREIQVKALARKPILPAVNTLESGYFRCIVFEQAFESGLLGFEVIAIDFRIF